MRVDVPPAEVIRESFWTGGALDRRGTGLQRLADCIGRVRPLIARTGRDYDDRCLMWALTAIAMHLAVESGATGPLAAMFRSNARLLDLAGQAGDRPYAGPDA
ncbi:hypothetical protein GCM10017083_04740 [Thalassobaculum fulvum]|jgi:hypothetical protein|uniref:Uncharacterized protein n=1 Tax=Thalassobaculum fulvum TaxID=1633335 RepID=A0A918XP88_9PROT|nr:hypothetical protein [Thalassobaculum fulvum]GHD40958.1 hypothetical protein GCM10017083_04740 [Thalassobaculum fulvum]